MITHTHQSVHDLIQDGWESDLPDKVLAALRPFDGKPTTTRLLKAMPESHGPWRLRREYGMTNLENDAYRKGDYKRGISLLFFHSESAGILNLRDVEERNTAYFSARNARNHARMEAMNSKQTLDLIAASMNGAERAIADLTSAFATVSALTEYGETLNPDRYTILRACGLMDKDGHYIIDTDYKRMSAQPTNVAV